MSHNIEVRLLFPNLGKERDEVVEMDNIEAIDWCLRRLAEPVDPDDLVAAITARAEAATIASEQAAAIAPPPEPRRRALKVRRSPGAR